MYLRRLQRACLLALVATAFVVQPLIARATAGVRAEEVACCCPDPDTCRCHDHDDGQPRPEAQLRKCGQRGDLVTQVVLLALALPAVPCLPAAPSPRDVPLVLVEVTPQERPARPVTPPF